ncbi:kelch motif domain-containing protein [Ditylenchus destructor]|uniref:Kelch motif domain-containing protein n=1 Tax=Ditylenchus destructor TaxID=166010 RepID=A0AAD4R875_9BILA|nr:kelch motif domain-containing protein [Ditylenchus destructor]
MHWTIHLEGGPRRVNHAAVAIGNQIFSFGGYCSGEVQCRNEPIDVHVLNTVTYRWQRVPSNAERKAQARRNSTGTNVSNTRIPQNAQETIGPSNSLEVPVVRRRARSVAELHPLGQLRYIRPALDSGNDDVTSVEETESEAGSSSSRFSSFIDETDAIDSDEVASLEVDSEDDDDADQPENFSDIDEEDEGSSDYDDPMPRAAVLPRRRHRLQQQQDAYDFLLALQQNILPMNAVNLPPTDQKDPQMPYQRYGHTVVAYKGKAYLWGGRNDEFGSSQLLHEYNPATNEWRVVEVEGGFMPPPRDGHTAVIHKDKMYVFGGFEEHNHRFSQETYVFDFNTRMWQQVNPEGETPQHRDFHTACVLDGKMYVFGGRSDEMGQFHSSQDKYCDELMCLDLSNNHWTVVKTKGQAPCGRRSHSVWTYNGRMYLFGGYQSTNDIHFNDLYEYNPCGNEWRLLNPTGQLRPSPRRRQCTILVGNRVFVFGGTMPRVKNGNNGLIDLADLLVLDLQPSLVTLCSEAMIRYNLHQSCDHLLPLSLRRDLHNMSTVNTISKCSNGSRVECTNG